MLGVCGGTDPARTGRFAQTSRAADVPARPAIARVVIGPGHTRPGRGQIGFMVGEASDLARRTVHSYFRRAELLFRFRCRSVCQGRRESTSVAGAKMHQLEGQRESWFGFWQGEREDSPPVIK